MKTALITGITGQDGSFLAEYLLEKGYRVCGLLRRGSTETTERLKSIYNENEKKITLYYGDMTDSMSIIRIISIVQPDEIYNLAAQSHVGISFDEPEYTADTDGVGTLRILEAVRLLGLKEKTRIYHASTSELYGKVCDKQSSLDENTPFHPFSPYGCAKLYAYWIIKNYREAYGMYAVNGILFNHESERRGTNFVTRKITLAAAKIACGLQEQLFLGNLDSVRDWGYAKDYVKCMHLMLQQETPEDFVIATGEKRTVREFCTAAFARIGITLKWHGSGIDETGTDAATGKTLVLVDKKFFRPSDVDYLLGNPSKARKQLGWNPRETTFEQLVEIMTDYDLQMVKGGFVNE